MNYIDLMDSIKKFEDLYKNVEQTQDKAVYLRERGFNDSLKLVNELIVNVFNDNDNFEMLCINFIEQINTIPLLSGCIEAAALALLNSYEFFLSLIYLLYKEEKYSSIFNLISKYPLCKNIFEGISSPKSLFYNELFKMENVFFFLSKIHLNKDRLGTNEEFSLIKDRTNSSFVSFENFYFTELLIKNIVTICNVNGFEINLIHSESNEKRVIMKKMEEIDKYISLLKLFDCENKAQFFKKIEEQKAQISSLRSMGQCFCPRTL